MLHPGMVREAGGVILTRDAGNIPSVQFWRQRNGTDAKSQGKVPTFIPFVSGIRKAATRSWRPSLISLKADYLFFFALSPDLIVAWAAASRAIGTRYGEQET